MKYKTRKEYIYSDEMRMKLLILEPVSEPDGADHPGILWIHGGGYITGMAEMVYMSRARNLVRKYGAVVVSPEYRLAGKYAYPAALRDCHQALLYLLKHAEELKVRSDQIMVGGESAGGGLAAALCMYEKDRGEINIAYQMPLYPMLDNEYTETSRNNHAPVWNTKRNRRAWACYLRGIEGKKVPAYASPSRREDYSGLPPAYTFVCTAEPFYAETLAYVDNLTRAGVDVKIDIYPNMFHAFDMLLPFLKVSRRAAEAFEKQFEHAMSSCFAKQNERT
ncbi:MAG: alpha/beta hydrolase [Oscillospiraceae bacterium]